MRHAMQLSAVALLLVLVPACDEDSTAPGGPAVDCGADVTEVDVSITTTADDVTFDWSPRCRVSYLGVEDGETYEVILWLSTPAGDRLVAVEEFQR